MKTKPLPSYEDLHRLLSYDPVTGVFRWKVRPHNRFAIGDAAGCMNKIGYRNIKINHRAYGAHRLAWKMSHGTDPSSQIDHISGNPFDNRIANLREATNGQNKQNSRRHSNNTSGVKGVSWHNSRAKWVAAIRIQNRNKHLGYFTDLDSAAAAYRAAAALHYGEFANHG